MWNERWWTFAGGISVKRFPLLGIFYDYTFLFDWPAEVGVPLESSASIIIDTLSGLLYVALPVVSLAANFWARFGHLRSHFYLVSSSRSLCLVTIHHDERCNWAIFCLELSSSFFYRRGLHRIFINHVHLNGATRWPSDENGHCDVRWFSPRKTRQKGALSIVDVNAILIISEDTASGVLHVSITITSVPWELIYTIDAPKVVFNSTLCNPIHQITHIHIRCKIWLFVSTCSTDSDGTNLRRWGMSSLKYSYR